MSNFIENVRQVIMPILNSAHVELVDIEFEKKFDQDNLTIFIETQLGVTLDDCEFIHRLIDPILDELDPTQGKPYVLNVSSPGLDRPLKTLRDFERNYGKDIEIKLYAPLKGKKLLCGTLLAHDQNTTSIALNSSNQQLKIENSKIATVKPLVKFN